VILRQLTLLTMAADESPEFPQHDRWTKVEFDFERKRIIELGCEDHNELMLESYVPLEPVLICPSVAVLPCSPARTSCCSPNADCNTVFDAMR
jgi:hypothetical protein